MKYFVEEIMAAFDPYGPQARSVMERRHAEQLWRETAELRARQYEERAARFGPYTGKAPPPKVKQVDLAYWQKRLQDKVAAR